MRILFVYSLYDSQSITKPLRSWSTIQFGISYISSVLKENGHQTKLLVLSSNKPLASKKKTNSFINEFGPDIVCFTAIFSEYDFIEKMAGFIKKQWPDKFLLIGGVHATLNPDKVIKGSFDALCIGEGEYPTLELCRQLSNNQTPHAIVNLWIKSHSGRIEKNDTNNFLQDLDSLPFPDRDMWKPWMKERLDDELDILLGRGCPYRCTYCCNHALQKVANGKYVRMRSPENILEELTFIHKKYPNMKRVYCEVESIVLNRSWLFDFCKQLKDFNSTIDKSISYGCNFRISPQSIDQKIFSTLKETNFYRINIGLESGSEKIRREVLKRKYSNEDFLKIVSMARKCGLKVYIFNMIGIPGETYKDHMETVSVNRQCQPDAHFTSIFYPYPGTELYDICVKNGLINHSIDTRMERRKSCIESLGFTKPQIQRAYTWFTYRVYKGYKPLWTVLMQVITVKMQSNTIANFLFRQIVQLPMLRFVRAKLFKKVFPTD